MRIGFIGLGRMGANMVPRLVRDGHEVVTEGAEGAVSVAELVAGRQTSPRRSSRSASRLASVRARTRTTTRRCSPRSATSSAATPTRPN